MILYFGHVRGNREDEDQLAKLTRLQACHAQIEPCTLAVDLGAERRKQQKLQQKNHHKVLVHFAVQKPFGRKQRSSPVPGGMGVLYIHKVKPRQIITGVRP